MTRNMKTPRQNARAAVYDRGDTKALSPEEASTVRMLARVCSEFTKTPGLRLTSRQARTVWGPTCIYVLSLLVDADFLCRFGDEYGLAMSTSAAVTISRSRLAGAESISRQLAATWTEHP